MNEGPDSGMFRRFDSLNILSLLYMQAKLVSLEKEFLQIRDKNSKFSDTETASYSESMDRLRVSKGQGGSEQRDLLLKIQGKLKLYNEAVSLQITCRGRLGPGSGDVRHLRYILKAAISSIVPTRDI